MELNLEKGMTTYSSILSENFTTEERGRLQSIGLKESDMTVLLNIFTFKANYALYNKCVCNILCGLNFCNQQFSSLKTHTHKCTDVIHSFLNFFSKLSVIFSSYSSSVQPQRKQN